MQYYRGRYFALEHPAGARSWTTSLMDQLIQLPRVRISTFDFCMCGMVATDADGEAPARKRTRVITNSEAAAAALEERQCDGTHRHASLQAVILTRFLRAAMISRKRR